MSINRFYAPFQSDLQDLWLDYSETHHLLHVKRVSVGDIIVLFNGVGDECDAKIVEIKRGRARVEIGTIKAISREGNVGIDIAFAIPKGRHSQFLIQKCTELGVQRLIPIHFERSVVRMKSDCSDKIDKWKRIVIEASKQCGRNVITEITAAVDFEDILKRVGDYDLSLVATSQSEADNLKNILQEHQKVNSIIGFIGPEGGFTTRELSIALDAGCQFVSLGKQILRVETAAIAISSILSYHYLN
ncbi:MAG: 16S rRNA (uracil(1498)-N(3))-methyltransferase [Candidatus Scalindua sp. AMX11]|nr:MAG: 16S rRNA (uracil(1498)-N(3))-methyltransferase [Candidatus Scalindua sp.]NOG83944.1 16S rRNA (uracil(1498)-N(3))-methyltransferase [Planctomycetota bacterium]RZV88015.1 MAG: 16S rRNA (uracil(1498)-N(3))-methyltransferase [Candidatus Scalindua sp. SCAELEC01]TDE64163.1 MAG: 16S rRNA (uracil(1498)-N(3))-methyltransferase [Candidatus Scalindua sp. AMX11]GJQ58407.1 MAG: ribosomal RNA small subunit methyltransferase E [Candidatus Scalindua sp.]